ncbi:MAG TPA: hypothetical protein VMR45_03490 [Patescibacteria group bacterium]|nr:hypothetical protein [Patescibacteria group bacterium]
MSAIEEVGKYLRESVFDGDGSDSLANTIELARTKADSMMGTVAGALEYGARSSHLSKAEQAFMEANRQLDEALGTVAVARTHVNLYLTDIGLAPGHA